MTRVAIGIPVHAEPARLLATLDILRRNTARAVDVWLLPDGPDLPTSNALMALGDVPQSGTSNPLGGAACFNRLANESDADILILLESGAQVGPGWLDHLCHALDADPRNALAGPSTNRAWNEQAVFSRFGDSPSQIALASAEALRRFGRRCRTLEPLYSLGDFCYAVRRSVIETIGPADEAYGLGPCWEMDYNIRAARAGFRGVWACAAYVHRAPFTERRRQEESDRFEDSKQRYQDKFCGARLRGEKADYRDHCRGDACPNFAPPALIAAESLVSHAPNQGLAIKTTPAPTPDADSQPLVTAIMPTCDRRSFVTRAVRLFLAQDYPNRELVVIDDGRDSIACDLPQDSRIRYIRLDLKRNIGAKRNLACAEARGDFIVHWDDDDWYPRHRISLQVRALLDHRADICGTSRVYYLDPSANRAWTYAYQGPGPTWVAGNTLAYRKSFWTAHRFPEIAVGEDARFVWSASAGKVHDLADATLCVASLHAGNSARKDVASVYWNPIDPAFVRALMGDEDSFPSASPQTARPLISCIMPTRNRRAFLPLALRIFDRQDYPSRELLIVDDGDDLIGDLVDGRPGVRYIRLRSRLSIGEKRNLACREAVGEIIVHWDDDDWYAPDRLSYQAAPILKGDADISGLENRYTLHLSSGEFWMPHPQRHRQMFYGNVHGGSIAFRRAILDRVVRYPATNLAEDAALLHSALHMGHRLVRQQNPGVYVYIRHGGNTWRFEDGNHPESGGWDRINPPPAFSPEDLPTTRRQPGHL